MAIFPATVNSNSPFLFKKNTAGVISMSKADGRFFNFVVNSSKHKACPPLNTYTLFQMTVGRKDFIFHGHLHF